MRKVFVSALAIIVFAIMGCNEAPKEIPYTINHYLDTIGNYVILTTVSNNDDCSSISTSTLLLNKVDTLTRKNTTSNDTK
jgi:hypothetical protein